MLEELKKEVLRVSRMAEDCGLCHHGGGNFSMMDRQKGLIAITPHAESRYALEDEDIIIVDSGGTVVENRKGLSPSSETVVHLEVLQARPDVNAVCHTHARYAAVFSVLNKPVKPVICESFMYGGFCRVAPFRIPGTMELARSAVEGLEGTEAVILQRHGLLTVGKSIYDAFLKSRYVEDVAEVCFKAASLVGYDNVEAFGDDQIEYMMRQLGLVG